MNEHIRTNYERRQIMERKYKSIEDIEERIDYLERAIFFEDMADRPNQDLIETHKRELKALEIMLKETKEKGIIIWLNKGIKK